MGEKVNQKNSWSSSTAQQDSVFKLRRFTTNDKNDEEIQKLPESLHTDINPSKFSLPKTPPFPSATVQLQEQNQEEKEPEEKPEINLKSDAPPTEEAEDESNSKEQDSVVNLKLDLLSTKTSEEEKENLESNSIQTKLTIGKPGDKYEQEADATAAKVMAMSNKESEEIHRQSHTNVATKPKVLKYSSLSLQAKANKISTSPNLESRLGSSKGGGSPLPDDVRGFMEPRFGSDFGDVRVHTDLGAVQMNKELGAQAFAHGNDIYYGAGKSPGNNELTAHELTHTIQQTGGLKLNKQVRPQEKEEEDRKQLQTKKIIAKTPEISLFKETASSPQLEEEEQTLQAKELASETPEVSLNKETSSAPQPEEEEQILQAKELNGQIPDISLNKETTSTLQSDEEEEEQTIQAKQINAQTPDISLNKELRIAFLPRATNITSSKRNSWRNRCK